MENHQIMMLLIITLSYGTYDGWILKVDAIGNIQWSKIHWWYHCSDFGNDIKQTQRWRLYVVTATAASLMEI
jgi:hypothetical protein